ncbi:MAG: hypothetical protein EOM50_20805 [Erysipelotrichia bacterium]|nr:hypothetical protein [Erysipelotrichia bacterium]
MLILNGISTIQRYDSRMVSFPGNVQNVPLFLEQIMLIFPPVTYKEGPGAALEPISAEAIQSMAVFLCVSLRRSDALVIIARYIHLQKALFTSDLDPVTDYKVILDVVHKYDPLLF